MSNPCGCSQNIITSSACPEFSASCDSMINTECSVLSVDLPNLGLVTGEGLDTALTAIDTAFDADIIEDKITIPSINILSLNSTPYTLIASPGSGKFIQILGLSVRMESGTIIYTVSGNNLLIKTLNASNTAYVIDDTCLTTINTDIVSIGKVDGTYDVIRTNDNLIIQSEFSDPTGGDGDLSVYITYIVKSI